MSRRELIVNALLPVLQGEFPDVSENDLSFFGDAADISSPIKRKYGLDVSKDIVYNLKTVSLYGEPLLGEIWECEGFLNLNVNDAVLEKLAKEAAQIKPESPGDIIPLGRTPEYLHAVLLNIAERGGFAPAATDRTVHRALWLALMADTKARYPLSLIPIASAVAAHRRGTARISAVQARAMALCLEKMITGS